MSKIKCLFKKHKYSDLLLRMDYCQNTLIATKRCSSCGQMVEIVIPLEELWRFFDKC